MKYLLGVDIGGTKCAVILGSLNNGTVNTTCEKDNGGMTILDKISFATEVQRGPDYALSRIINNVESILKNNNKRAKDICCLGISCGGPLDSRGGVIMSPPNLTGWDKIHIVDIMESRLGIKTRLQNDANACALAEWKFGAGAGCNNVIFLTFGTGMGAGLILGGRLYDGTNGMAGEVGHIRLDDNGPVGYGKAGSFEGFCSGGGIAQLARIKVLEKLQRGEKVSFCEGIEKLDSLNAKIVGEAAENGDELAAEIYRICGCYLGRGLSVIIDMLNPEIIVIGSIFARSRRLLWDETRKVIERECLEYSRNVCRVVPSLLGENIGDYAALAVAANE